MDVFDKFVAGFFISLMVAAVLGIVAGTGVFARDNGYYTLPNKVTIGYPTAGEVRTSTRVQLNRRFGPDRTVQVYASQAEAVAACAKLNEGK